MEAVLNCRATSSPQHAPAAKGSRMRALGQEEASKHCRAARREPAGRGCASTRESPTHPAGTRPSRAWQSWAAWLQDKTRRTGSWHAVTTLWALSRMPPIPLNQPVMRQEVQGSQGSRCPAAGGAFRDSASLLCPQPRSCFVFLASSCLGFKGPLALRGINPALAQHGQTQPGPKGHLCMARGTDPIPIPHQRFKSAEMALRGGEAEGSSSPQRRVSCSPCLQSHSTPLRPAPQTVCLCPYCYHSLIFLLAHLRFY